MIHAARVGVFGGTFDPIHVGHLAAVQDAAYNLSFDRVLFVPNRQPPHKLNKEVSDPADRVAMVELSLQDNPLFELSTVELEREGPSYSLDTLRQLKDQLGMDTELYFLVGCDALPDLHTWHQPQILLEEFQLVVMDRPTGTSISWSQLERRFPRIRQQVKVIDIVQLEISSSDIRRRVNAGQPIRYYVLPAVEHYIRDRSLYRSSEARS